MPYVVSTCSNDNHYPQWETTSGIGTIVRQVTVRGGSGRASSAGNQIYTPDGVRTELPQADIDFLLRDEEFKRHMDRGFMKIIKSAKDPDTVAQDMNSKDGSRPKTPTDIDAYNKDFVKKAGAEGAVAAVTNKGK